MPIKPLIIIGTGLAGYTLAREFRKLDQETSITIFTSDDGSSYSKPLLSNAFAKGKSADDLAMFDAEQMANQLKADIFINSKVVAVSHQTNTIKVYADQHFEHEYSQLVFALGADQIQIPFAGNAADDVLTVNDLQDYSVFRQRIDGAKKVAIIGGGLIGCEFANDLKHAGFDVHVIERNSLPLHSLLPAEAAQDIQAALTKLGIVWHMSQSVTQVNKENNQYTLTLTDNGSSGETENNKTLEGIDLVLSAIGLRPRTELASASGIESNKGIIVDRQLRTNIKNIFALGDCAEVHGLVLPFVMPLMHSARALAKALTNQEAQVNYPAMPVVVKTPAHPIIILPPPQNLEGQWQTTVLDDGTRSVFMDKDNVIRGFALTGSAISERSTLIKDVPGLLD